MEKSHQMNRSTMVCVHNVTVQRTDSDSLWTVKSIYCSPECYFVICTQPVIVFSRRFDLIFCRVFTRISFVLEEFPCFWDWKSEATFKVAARFELWQKRFSYSFTAKSEPGTRKWLARTIFSFYLIQFAPLIVSAAILEHKQTIAPRRLMPLKSSKVDHNSVLFDVS